MKSTAVLVCVKDRPTELAMLLESLYFQTYKDFDIIIVDDCSGTQFQNYHFLSCVINKLILSGHKVMVKRNDFGFGVSKNRQECVRIAKEIGDYKYYARVDDDVVLEQDFLERLVKVIDAGYDIASGVTPPMSQPNFIRDSNLKILNRVILDKDGNYLFNGDDCGMEYTESKILPAHHFRSSALYKAEIHDKVNYTPTKLTKHGFREEQIFSYKCQMEGYKIGVDTGAIAWHQMTPSGGERFPESQELIKQNEKILKEFTKEHKDKLNKIFGQPEITVQEQMIETNLANRI